MKGIQSGSGTEAKFAEPQAPIDFVEIDSQEIALTRQPFGGVKHLISVAGGGAVAGSSLSGRHRRSNWVQR